MSEDKGQWAEVAEDGIAPTDDDDGTTGRTTGDDRPATAGHRPLAGDDADATTERTRPDAGGRRARSQGRGREAQPTLRDAPAVAGELEDPEVLAHAPGR